MSELEQADELRQAIACHQRGQFAEAETIYRRLLAAAPSNFDALHLLGVVLHQQGRHDDAARWIGEAIAINPAISAAHVNLGAALLKLRQFDAALASYDRALTLRPRQAEVLVSRGRALLELGRREDALASFELALSIKPGLVDALLDRADTLHDLKRHQDALVSYDSALALDPRNAKALNNRGAALQALTRPDAALASYDQALAIKRDYVNALHNRGAVLAELKRYDEATEAFRQLVAMAPDYDYALGNLLACSLHCCDWSDVVDLRQRVIAAVAAGRRAIVPFSFLAVSPVEADQLRCAQSYVADKFPEPAQVSKGRRPRPDRDRIRIAYASADLHDHATAYLMAGLFEAHDKSRFETTAVSFGPDNGGPMRTRLRAAFDHFLDVRGKSDREVAAMLVAADIDIAVDLKGFTLHARPGIFAHRAAPVQVNYLGFPATMGAPYIDYIVADHDVLPPGEDAFFTEKIVRLPGSYQVNDSQRRVASVTPSRVEAGLPASGFVFCCFNSSYKITPEIFSVWMRLLQAVPGSVLWLLADNAAASANLRAEAHRRGVAGSRLVFAPRMPLDAHLARHRLADLGLDTLPYNAHTTASDALWAGLPLVTCAGTAFAGRVAASLLKAVGLPELITHDLERYEALALHLATAPALLGEMHTRLIAQRDASSLFDTLRFCRHLEAAYTHMWEREQRGEPAAAFDVPLLS